MISLVRMFIEKSLVRRGEVMVVVVMVVVVVDVGHLCWGHFLRLSFYTIQ
jgi:hypothetical protein